MTGYSHLMLIEANSYNMLKPYVDACNMYMALFCWLHNHFVSIYHNRWIGWIETWTQKPSRIFG